MYRSRHCIRQDNGDETVGCEGRNRDTSPCNIRNCPENGKWSQWGEWSECSVTCGRGNRQRSRICYRNKFGGRPCVGDNIEIEECKMYACHKRSIPKLKSAALRLKGNLNGEVLQDMQFSADISNDGPKRVVTATVQDILKQQAGWFPYLAFLLPPVSWNAAAEQEDANNGYTLTNGTFTEESKFQFATGQELFVTHDGKGIDKDGKLKVEIEVKGSVPIVEPRGSIIVNPYSEDYVQTGPNSLYSNSRSSLDINGKNVPFSWNKTVSYDSDLGTMPFLVERLSTRPLANEYNVNNQELKFASTSEISRKYDEDKCPVGFKLDLKHQHCSDINECIENRRACHPSQICENQFGSYKCHCRVGFRMSTNGKRCVDINECKEEMPCSHDCQNTRGSYQCLCPPNYVLGEDKMTCESWEEANNQDASFGSDDDYYGPDSDYLESRQSPEEIACKPGFVLESDKCIDEDECERKSHSCSIDQTCINLLGSYNCIDTPCIGDYELDLESG
uniref:EGF-like domain-containing protein n=3 Tax=Clastoptera arizonana TaxID=38151 RepID=A0A1B6CU47_9HEMI